MEIFKIRKFSMGNFFGGSTFGPGIFLWVLLKTLGIFDKYVP